MKTVAASKLRTAEARKEAVTPFFQSASAGLAGFAPQAEFNFTADKKTLFIVITSDRGLCGSVNSSVIRAVKALFKHGTLPPTTELVVIGDKGRAGLAKEHGLKFRVTAGDLDKRPLQFSDLEPIADFIVTHDPDQLGLITNKFISIIAFETHSRALKPLKFFVNEHDYTETEFDGWNEDILAGLYQYNIQALLFSSIIENQAVELGARMSSMDNATRNAGDMLNFLTISYNKKRQTMITTELVEIISGAQSLEQQEE
jgi:F-type H+-transporting ATPase subunit gamma